MREKISLFMAVSIMVLARCSAPEAASGKTSDSSIEAAKTNEEEMAANPDGAADFDNITKEYAITEPTEKQYTCQEITITLPEEWTGRCVIVENERSFSIYQKASYEIDNTTGYVCGFFQTQEPIEYEHGKTLVAYTEDGSLYYLVQPTDVPCDTDDEKIIGEYVRMCQQVPQIKISLQIAAPGVHYHADEFIFPTSSIFPLDQAMLAGLSDNTLWIAKNEIYARHGRQFLNMYLQEYFNRCTWYDGSEIIDLDIRWYDFLPSFSHTLYEDLPVYFEQEETSAAAVIPAQEEVFFLGTDAEHWILVKGKDGSQGYMFVENGRITTLDKPAEEVFSNLQFSG